jgi:hypothetical protein
MSEVGGARATGPTGDTSRAPGRQPLRVMLAEAGSGVLLFGITPPRLSASAEQVREIAAVTRARLASLDLDGLVLYDIDDESDRNPADLTF